MISFHFHSWSWSPLYPPVKSSLPSSPSPVFSVFKFSLSPAKHNIVGYPVHCIWDELFFPALAHFISKAAIQFVEKTSNWKCACAGRVTWKKGNWEGLCLHSFMPLLCHWFAVWLWKNATGSRSASRAMSLFTSPIIKCKRNWMW